MNKDMITQAECDRQKSLICQHYNELIIKYQGGFPQIVQETIAARDKWWLEHLKEFRAKLKVSFGIINVSQEALFELSQEVFPIKPEIDENGKILNTEQIEEQSLKQSLQPSVDKLQELPLEYEGKFPDLPDKWGEIQ